MLTSHLGTNLDSLLLARDHQPAYKVLLFSRMQDSDTAIVTGNYVQRPIDLTPYVIDGALNLDMDTDAGSLSLNVSLDRIPSSLFTNCVVKLYEGDARVPESQWPNTFTGWHVGQPGVSEETTINSRTGKRGEQRSASISFVGRESIFAEFEVTNDGVWLPNETENPDPEQQHRNDYDDIGNIAREVATNDVWGMGLDPVEVEVGPLPYRIQKQLQFVGEPVMTHLKTLGEVLHLVPQFNGEGKLRFISRLLTLDPVREYDGSHIAAITQSNSSFMEVNAITAIGLSNEITEVVKPRQRLFAATGTFGYFDQEIVYQGAWGSDEQPSLRVKNGTVVDGNGETVESPTIENFKVDGFIKVPVGRPEFLEGTDELFYRIEVKNEILYVIAILGIFFAGYISFNVAAQDTERQGAQLHTHDPVSTVPDPKLLSSQETANNLKAIADGLLIGALTILQQIGNFEFEVFGVPYESVYAELRSDAILSNFSGFTNGNPFREYERKSREIKNYIFSSIEDEVVPAGPSNSQPETTNPGLRSFAMRELAIAIAEQGSRQVEMVKDILIEPGDVFVFRDIKYKIKSISRNFARAGENTQSANVYRVS